MSNTVIKVENLSKLYRLGEVGTGTVSHDLNRWLAKIRGKEDPFALVGQVNDRTQKSESDYVWSLKDINFEVKQGDVLGIIGKNGAGKSTLLKLLSQITSPTTGEIKIKGRIAALLEVGTGMHPEMTARENIFLNGAIMGMRKHEIKTKFDEIIDFAGCAMYVDTPIKRFSSGMRVRLGFAVAAFLEPEILIVDEVLAVGDAEFQSKAIGKMQDVSAKEGRTVLFVSHNMGAVRRLCKTGIILSQGSVKHAGEINEIVDLYINEGTENVSQHTNYLDRSASNGMAPKCLYLFDRKRNQYSNSFNSENEIEIQFAYEITEPLRNFRIVLGILSNDDQVLFSYSSHFIEPAIKDIGKYQIKFIIPENIFNTGIYKVRLNAGQPGVKIIMEPEILAMFSVEKIQNSSNYASQMPGWFAPELKVLY